MRPVLCRITRAPPWINCHGVAPLFFRKGQQGFNKTIDCFGPHAIQVLQILQGREVVQHCSLLSLPCGARLCWRGDWKSHSCLDCGLRWDGWCACARLRPVPSLVQVSSILARVPLPNCFSVLGRIFGGELALLELAAQSGHGGCEVKSGSFEYTSA